MTDDPHFHAWLDGELSPEEAARMAAKVAADPELRRLADQHHAVRERLRFALDAITAAPSLQQPRAATRPSAEVIDMATARERRGRSVWRQAAAMAATLVLGIVVGVTLIGGDPSIREEDGHLLASGELKQALTTRLASAGQNDAVRIGLTFRDRRGEFCRSFSSHGSAGLACRENEEWRFRGLFQQPHGQRGDYRMAAAQDSLLMELVDATIAGEPLDAAAEAELVQSSWRPLPRK